MSQLEIKEDLEALAKRRNQAEEKNAILSALFPEDQVNECATAQKLGKSAQELGNFPEEKH
ncbi:MAG: hypothetical protein JWQ38_1352 [Flavipsychrobacter sp.]|nr:hypothetical protein [Flavipsychrobacter sp.]